MKDSALIFSFLTDLVSHNNRDWFQANKSAYEKAWGVFNVFLEELIAEIGKFEPAVAYLTPKDCTYRIYRDLRFSPDKTPYKGHFGAYINECGKKAFYGGYYIQLEPRQVFLASGVWWLPTKELRALRQAIIDQSDTYGKIVNNPDFKEICPVIGVEFYKRMPNDVPKDYPHPEYVMCKNYTCSTSLTPEQFQKATVKEIAEKFRLMKPFNDFLKENILINLEEMEGMKDVVKFI
jgi:TIGR02453 family protein